DGIRDFHVTGVQTCALPISDPQFHRRKRRERHCQWAGIVLADVRALRKQSPRKDACSRRRERIGTSLQNITRYRDLLPCLSQREIGRASCRESVLTPAAALE